MRKCSNFLLPAFLLLTSVFAAGQPAYDRTRLADFFQSNDYEGAISWLQSQEGQRASLQYQADLGYAYFMNEEYNQARASFLNVFKQQPDNPQAISTLPRPMNSLKCRIAPCITTCT